MCIAMHPIDIYAKRGQKKMNVVYPALYTDAYIVIFWLNFKYYLAKL